MVQGRDRRVELGYYLALLCRKNIFYPLKNKNSKHNTKATADNDNSAAGVNTTPGNTVKASA
jgi:hypothetical protein